jgi:hypothetical protein
MTNECEDCDRFDCRERGCIASLSEKDRIKPMTPKVVRNGQVAVIYSPGFGAGWSSWNTDHPNILFDPPVVTWIEGGKKVEEEPHLKAYLEETYPEGYFSLHALEIEWLPQGTAFRIHASAGSEQIVLASQERWNSA